MPDFYQWDNNGQLTLFCHLQPKASKDEFAGQYGERLKVRITAAPIDGKANTQLIKFIAKQFGVAKAKGTISSGESSRHKTLNIENRQCRPEGLGIVPDPASRQ